MPHVNIVGASFITALEIALFTFGIKRVPLPTTPNPIAVRLVPLAALPQPVPAEAMPIIETVPTALAMPKPEPPPKLSPKPAPIVEAAPLATPKLPPAKPPPRHVGRHLPQPPAPPTSPPRSETPDEAPTRASAASSPGGGTMGARALYKPMPEIPEDLRRRNLTLIARARFSVARDGSVQVELIRATPLPKLNRALLSALMKWRFFPALENGKPIASTIEINIPIEVK